MALLVRPAQLGGRTRYVAFVGGIAVVVVGIFLIVFLITATDTRVQEVGGPQAQLVFILRQPLGFLGILSANLQSTLLDWTLESIGILGWFTIALPTASYLLVVLGGLGFFFRMKEDVNLELWRRALLAAAGVAVFLTMAVALYAFLEPAGSQHVSIQGRYLAPVWLLLLLSVYGIGFAKRQLGRFFTIGVLLAIMVQNIQTLISAYHP
jgi:uncharacterized membrane protein